MHALEESPHETPIWREGLAVKKVSDYIPHKSKIQIFYSSMDWLDEYIAKMEIHQGKKYFCFHDKYYGFIDIFYLLGSHKGIF